MLKILLVLLVIWLALSVIGFVVKSLLWLGLIALALFVITSIVGYVKRNQLR